MSKPEINKVLSIVTIICSGVTAHEERTSIENGDYTMLLERRHWLESRPQDRRGCAKAKNEKYELSQRAVL